METVHRVFLQALKAAMEKKALTEPTEMTPQQWQAFFRLAQIHKVLPLVYQAVYAVPNAQLPQTVPPAARQQAVLQALRTEEFLQLYDRLVQAGITPIVVKGYVCRQLYPQPDLRPSSDEDILIPPEQYALCHQVLRGGGMSTQTAEPERENAYEVPYRKDGGMLYIELHKHLFDPASESYGDWNLFFRDAFSNAIREDRVLTLSHTDHLLYLILHALKHFLHSGFGVRQICDIAVFANAHGKDVDWERLLESCRRVRGEVFAATVFSVAEKYLVFDPKMAGYPALWQSLAEEEDALLEDLLTGGIYGGATLSRKHSSNMTLDAVTADRQGKKAKPSLKNTLFPSAGRLSSRYPYLKKHPWLLPVAWVSRVFQYGKTRNGDNSAADALKIGKGRITLLKKYKVIR